MVPRRLVDLRERLDRLDQRIAGIDVHPGLAVGQAARGEAR